MMLVPRRSAAAAALMIAASIAFALSRAIACPFCAPAMQTLSEEIGASDVAMIAVLEEPMPTSAPDDLAAAETAAAKFRIVEVLHGAERLEGAETIDVVYFGEEAPDKQFMITGLAGVTGPGLDWTSPIPLSPRAVEYVKQLKSVPAEGSDRLNFFQNFLEDEDPLLAQDAYDEFARSPYAALIDLKPRMDRPKLIERINDSSVGPSGRRLYLTMLGICGEPDDFRMLEQLMNYDYLTMQPGIAAAVATGIAMSPTVGLGLIDEMLHAEERRKRESLDALIACYLKLKGPDGLALIDQLFLANPRVEYKQLHSAIMALRFHGEETDVIPRERLLESMRLCLDHHDFADQVIPDLTRWEDWDVMPRLIGMFKESKKDDWIRQPVVSYLLVAADAPGDVGKQATAAIAELEAVDPETVERARSLSAFGFLQRAAATPGTTPAATSTDVIPPPVGESSTVVIPPPAGETATVVPPTSGEAATPPADAGAAATTEPAADPLVPGVPEERDVAATKGSTKPTKAAPLATTLTPPSKIKIIGVPLLAAAVLLGVFAVLLRGADPRSSDDA